MNKIIIDTDPGVDDALAIIFALKNNLGVDCLFTVFGNSNITNTSKNACTILQLLNSNIPVYKGASRPLVGDSLRANSHGENGLGGFKVENLKKKCENESATVVYINKLSKQKFKVVLLGPSTNFAKAIKENPNIICNIEEVIILGGCIGEQGNVTNYAEFNVYNDPEALDIVLNSGLNVTLIPINICRKVVLTNEELSLLTGSMNSSYIQAIAQSYIDYYTKGYDGMSFQGGVLYDVLPIAYLINPLLFEVKSTCIKIDCEDERGRTQEVDLDFNNCNLVTDIDSVGVKNLFVNTIKKL